MWRPLCSVYEEKLKQLCYLCVSAIVRRLIMLCTHMVRSLPLDIHSCCLFLVGTAEANPFRRIYYKVVIITDQEVQSLAD